MSMRVIAALIPANYRKEILELNIIGSAQPIESDASMHYLSTIWKNYIAPDEVINCPLCYQRVLRNYRELLPILIDLEKESKLLDQL